MPDRDATLNYLDQVLDRDPMVEGPTIIAARNAFLGLAATEAPSAQSYEAAQEERESLRAELSTLQEVLPGLEEGAALQRLDAIDASAHPDLAAWKSRMRHFAEVAEFRAEARSDTRITSRVLDAFDEIATAPEEIATTLRSRALAKLSGNLSIQAAKRLHRDYPELYDLEAEWFDRILSQKRDKKLASSPAAIGGTFIVIWIILKVVAALARNS